MTGIVDVGGGIRGVYSSGIYDAFLDEGFMADYCLGVSAGAANLITYIAGQRGRTFTFYYEYFHRSICVGVESFLKKGVFLNLDYLYEELSNDDGENPLDFRRVMESDTLFRLVATNADNGEARYFDKSEMKENNYSHLKATCCLPVVCKAIEIEGTRYYDGGLSDTIPYKKALEDGCDKILLVLTKPREEYLKPSEHLLALRAFGRREEKILELTENMHIRNRQALEEIERLEKQGKIIVVQPRDCFGMKTLTKDKNAIIKMYHQGYEDGLEALERLKG